VLSMTVCQLKPYRRTDVEKFGDWGEPVHSVVNMQFKVATEWRVIKHAKQ